MLILLATLLCLSSEPANDVDHVHEVDGYVEINTVLSSDNKVTMKQIIVKRWIHELGGHHVVHWILIDDDYEPSVVKLSNGSYRVTIRRKSSERFIIECRSVHWSVTNYDPELEDRQKLPSDNRKLYFHYHKPSGIKRFKPIILLEEPRFN